MRTISSVSTGRTRRFTTLACTTRLLPKFRNILILLYQVHYIIAGSISAFQLVSISARRLRRLVSRVARFVAPQHSTKLLPERRLAKRDRPPAKRRKAEMLTSGGRRPERADKLPKVAC